MNHFKGINGVLLGIFLVAAALFLGMAMVQCAPTGQGGRGETSLQEIPFDGAATHGFLRELCAIGPRPTGSEGMARQQAYLEKHFREWGAAVEYQRFQFAHPENGTPVVGANLIFRWKPERKERILLCAHYDTLPLPLLDPPGSTRPFVGAEDNGGGVAILMQLAKSLPEMLEKKQTRYGVDLVMLDAEEYMFRPRGRFCLGAEFFARQYASQTEVERGFTYVCGILLDMVTQKDVVLLRERQSYLWRDTRPVVDEVWATARRLGVREFRPQTMASNILDDHVMLHNLGKIPVIDIIDLDYAPWHTSADTADKCSPLSMARVGWVVSEWLANRP